jgi:hypothetical protein
MIFGDGTVAGIDLIIIAELIFCIFAVAMSRRLAFKCRFPAQLPDTISEETIRSFFWRVNLSWSI